MRALREWFSLRQQAQSLAETALLLPVIMVILLGTVDFGRAFFTQVAITNAARVGAAYGMDSRWPVDSADGVSGVRDKVIAEAGPLVGLQKSEVSVSRSVSTWDSAKYDLTVTITRQFTPIAPYTEKIFGGSIVLRATATSRQVN